MKKLYKRSRSAKYSVSHDIVKQIEKLKVGKCFRVSAKHCVGYSSDTTNVPSANIAWRANKIGAEEDKRFSVLSLRRGGCVVIRNA